MKRLLPLSLPLCGLLFTFVMAANTNDFLRLTSTRLSPAIPIGGAAVVTWSIVPDGTILPSFGAVNPNPPSNLIARFDTLYNVPGPNRISSDLTARPWFAAFASSFQNYGRKSGLSYQYVHDTDASAPFTSGALAGQRGDVRIGGTALSATLGYNNSPDGSDMVLNTFGNVFANLAALQLVVTHEHAHGLGLDHVLVEGDPALSVVSASGGNVNGPQFDDLLQIHRKYGDKNETGSGNNDRANAVPLGVLAKGLPVALGEDASGLSIQASQEDFVSIDDDSDRDFYAFTLPESGGVTIEVAPRGPSYNFVPEGGISVFLDTQSESDLVFQVRNAAGVILLIQDQTLAGGSESLTGELLPAGDYFVEVLGKANRAQMYAIQVIWGEPDADGDGLPDGEEVAGDADGDGLENVFDPDADGDGTTDGAEVGAARLPYDVRDLAFEFEGEGEGELESWSGNNLVETPHVSAGQLMGVAMTGDPQLQRNNLFINGDLLTGLLVRLKSSDGTTLILFWSYDGAGGGGFSAARRATSTYGGAGDFENVFFDLSNEPEWLGKKITSLRLDPPGAVGSTFGVDWIRGLSSTRDGDGDGRSDQGEVLQSRNPYSATDLAFEFNLDGDFEGWDGTNNITDPIVAAGLLSGKTVTGDPFRTNTNLQFPGSDVPVLLIKLEASQSGSVELFWGITGANNFSGTRRLSRTYASTEGAPEILVFDLISDPSWLGQEVRRLRVDPINRAGTDFAIDWIRGSDGDFDDDGVPDIFEAAQGLNLLDPNDVELDFDGDGQSNFAEYIAGTAVNDASESLVFESCSRVGSQFTGSLHGKAGREYRLLRWSGREGEPWQVILGVIGPLGVDELVTLTDTAATESSAFYRAEVTFPE